MKYMILVFLLIGCISGPPGKDGKDGEDGYDGKNDWSTLCSERMPYSCIEDSSYTAYVDPGIEPVEFSCEIASIALDVDGDTLYHYTAVCPPFVYGKGWKVDCNVIQKEMIFCY